MEMATFQAFLLLACKLIFCLRFTSGKECTNIPTQLSSHTYRFELLSSRSLNTSTLIESATSSRNQEEFMPNPIHVARKAMESQETFLQELPLHAVRISPDSLHGRAQRTNLEYLLMLDVDSLVWSFRKNAGLPTPGSPYGGWESPDTELRGHFVGHYMSATALMWASTHNITLQMKMNALVDALSECQQKIGTGYLSAFPSELFDRFEQIRPVWAPYYTIHKIMAGLLDQYTLAQNNQALTMVVNMANYFYIRVNKVIEQYTIERHWLSLNEETGGMNDVLYRLYNITGDETHIMLAHLFDKPCFLGLLAVQADSISGFHANTHIPVIVGAQMRFEITGDILYKDIGTFFLDVVDSSHSYATGGTSMGEFWTDPKRLGDAIWTTETEESCTTYNMLKVARHLFSWTKEMRYVDYYEHALTNGVLSIQRGEDPGVMIYMLPLGPGYSKAVSYHGWGTQFSSFWCCYGTGIESFSKLGDSIYFQEYGSIPSLYVVQFISSTISWDAAGIYLNQIVNDPSSSNPYIQISIGCSHIPQEPPFRGDDEGINATIHIRIPFWVASSGCNATLNGDSLQNPLPGTFLNITRLWPSGDELDLLCRVTLRAEMINDDREEYASVYAFAFGPYLLAALSSGQWVISGVHISSLYDWIEPVPDSYSKQLYTFGQEKDGQFLVLTHSTEYVYLGILPREGTNEVAYSTFRIVDPVAEKLVTLPSLRSMLSKDGLLTDTVRDYDQSANPYCRAHDLTGNLVAFELFDQPAVYVSHSFSSQSIRLSRAETVHMYSDKSGALAHGNYHQQSTAIFNVVPGLSGQCGSVSFEAITYPGCFLCTQETHMVGLRCQNEEEDALSFSEASSFTAIKGLASYHPMSFMAKGANQQYLLFPLLAYRDENYTVYFNVSSVV